MSLIRDVDEAVRMCKAEESKLNEAINQCRQILHSMRTRVTEISELGTTADSSEKDDILPEERREIEMLEQVLKKALRIRSTSEAHRELQSDSNKTGHPIKSENNVPTNDTVKEENKRKPVKSASSSETCRKTNHQRQAAGGGVNRRAMTARPVSVRNRTSAHSILRGKQSVLKSAPDKMPSTGSQQMICVKATSSRDPSEDISPSVSSQPPYQERLMSGKGGKSTTGSLQANEQWIESPLVPVWRAQRAKQNKLWNKVLIQESRPVQERSHFTERLRATFPSEWPSGSPADVTTELDRLAQRCVDLTHCFSAELQTQRANRSCPAGSEPGTLETREFESSLMLDGVERMMEELLTCASRWKKEWERWNQRRSETLCSVRRRGEWSDSDGSCLPPVLSYSSETQLRELESRRLRVEQLKQAVHLQQAMSENFASCWNPMHSSSERPSPVTLRGLYSLLAEGGEQFPSLVLDSESD